MGCDAIGLQETRRSGHSAFSQAGYLLYCSGECGGENGGKKGQGGVGLAVRNSITRAARPPEFISDCFLKVTLELRNRAKAITFVVAYAPTKTQNAYSKHSFWTSLDRVVEEVPKHEQLFVWMDANARTGRREKGQVGSKDSKIVGAYGRDTLNNNGELLLSFANNHDLALVNTFFSTPKDGVSHTFNGRGKKGSTISQRGNVIAKSHGTLRCTLSPPSFPFRTTILCPHPSSSSAIFPETAGGGPQLIHQWTAGAW